MSKIVNDSRCPECAKTGHDKGSNHLLHFDDGGRHCPKSEYHISGKPYTEIGSELKEQFRQEQDEEREIDMTDVKEIAKLNSIVLMDRHLNQETLEHYGVKVSVDGGNGEPLKHFYPVTQSGKVTGYKIRTLPKSFKAVGDTKNAELFGQSVTPAGGKKLVIVEGELDAMSVFQVLYAKYPNFKPSVVSLTSGANVKSVADNIDYVNSFNEVLLCLDNDQAGKDAQAEIASLLGPKTKIMSLATKDASESLVSGDKSGIISAFFSASTYTPVGIIEGGIGLDVLMTPIKEGIRVPSLPGTMDKLQGFRKKELTIVLAPAGVGKTTISKEIGYALNKGGEKIVHVFLEEDLKKTQQSYIAIDNDVHLAKLRKDPSCVSREAAQKSYNELVENQLYINHWGTMSPDQVMENFRYGAGWGATFGILDHISMVFSGSDNGNERKEIDMLLTALAAFTTESGMHLIVISHIKRSNKAPRKSDSYPYWDTVASDSGRGSGAFEQLADNIITLEVEILDENQTKGRIRTRVAKNREWAQLGVGDVLDYSMETGRISPSVSSPDAGGGGVPTINNPTINKLAATDFKHYDDDIPF